MDIEAAKLIGAGLAVIGMIGSGIGIGNVFSSFILAVGRNPAARGEVFTMTMLGFALVEAIAVRFGYRTPNFIYPNFNSHKLESQKMPQLDPSFFPTQLFGCSLCLFCSFSSFEN